MTNYCTLEGKITNTKLVTQFDGSDLAEGLIHVPIGKHGEKFCMTLVTAAWCSEKLQPLEGKTVSLSGRLTMIDKQIVLYVDWIPAVESEVVEEEPDA
jgi:hypothetical protein